MRYLRWIMGLGALLCLGLVACQRVEPTHNKISLESRVWKLCLFEGKEIIQVDSIMQDTLYKPYMNDSALTPYSLHFKKIQNKIYMRGKVLASTLSGSFAWDSVTEKVLWESINLRKKGVVDSLLEDQWMMALIGCNGMEIDGDSVYDCLRWKWNDKVVMVFKDKKRF